MVAALLCTTGLMAQLRNADVYETDDVRGEEYRTEIRIPDVGKFKVLKSDLHIHTFFSDGSVAPGQRVKEAWQEGLDVIAITDHVEYRPHKDYILGDLNTSYKQAAKAAKPTDLLVIHGAEITRSKPLGHLNALFIEDGNKLDVPNELDALEEALKQGAFIQWNHPGWPDDKSTFYPIHEKLIAEGKIHGVEVVNHTEFYPLVFDWPGKYNLAPAANTDVHGLVSLKFAGRRPMTLVLSESRTLDGVKEALFARRTIAYYDNTLIGSEELLKSLVFSCVEVRFATDGSVIATNKSDLDFNVTCKGVLYLLGAGKTVNLRRKIDASDVFQFENCFIGHEKKLTITPSDFQ